MKNIKYTTMAGRTFEVQFNEDAFFDYMRHCGIVNLKIQNQVSLYINNMHESLFDVPYDSVQFIKFSFSKDFRKRYSDINDILKYDL
jgi:hypothetical protein